MKMAVLAGDLKDPKDSGVTYTIEVPRIYEHRINTIRPRPNGSWYDVKTGDVVATGCTVTLAGIEDEGSTT